MIVLVTPLTGVHVMSWLPAQVALALIGPGDGGNGRQTRVKGLYSEPGCWASIGPPSGLDHTTIWEPVQNSGAKAGFGAPAVGSGVQVPVVDSCVSADAT
jgi:hypothetical protein